MQLSSYGVPTATFVFCRSQNMVENGEITAVIIGDAATLKRVYYYPDKQKLVLQAENPKYEPFVYVGSNSMKSISSAKPPLSKAT